MNITDISGKTELSNEVEIPYLGLGVWRSENGKEVIEAVTSALDVGYRLIDTAAMYLNEEGVGIAVNQHPVPRENIFITSKVWNTDHGYEQTIKAFHLSLKKLGVDYLDLYLVHWPVKNKYKDTWRALETLYEEGKIRAIGVSNFLQPHLEDLLESSKITPMVNQVEHHPWLLQQELVSFCKANNIQYESWSPLIKGKVFEIPLFQVLSEKYKKNPAQLVLRWNIQNGIIPIPKSIRPDRIRSNADIFDFVISEEDMHEINRLDENKRLGADPNDFRF